MYLFNTPTKPMKTAEELASEISQIEASRHVILDADDCILRAIKEFELDAYNQGLTDALMQLTDCGVVDCGNSYCEGIREKRQAIVQLRDSKTMI
jgi:hypothetical protein